MALHALSHEEIVLLTRSVHARRAQYDVREIVAYRVEIAFCLKLAASVGSVRTRTVVLRNVLIGLSLVYGAIHAERTKEYKTLERHLQFDESVHQIARSVGVHTSEVGIVQTFGHARSVHHIVERVAVELSLERVFRRKVKLNEVDAAVGEVSSRCGLAHCRPYLHAAAQGFFYNKTANETAGTGYKNLVSHYE